MFTAITPHKKFVALSGEEHVPVFTMQNSENRRLCHIINEDECYAAFLEIEDIGFTPITYIFSELHDALCSLPNPEHADDGD